MKYIKDICKALFQSGAESSLPAGKLEKKLLRGKASAEEALKLYDLYLKAGRNFPLELELNALEILIKDDPKRTDLIQRSKQVKQLLGRNISIISRSGIEKQSNPENSVRVHKPVFIVGCGRSGTTMLFRILSNSRELEPTFGFPDGEDHIGWLQYGGAIISGLGHESYESGIVGFNACLHMDRSHVTDDVVNQLHQYYFHEVLGGQENKRVLNKCPHLSNKIDYVRTIFHDAKFIHIVRDCLPVVASWVEIMKAVPEVTLYWPETEYPCFWAMRLPEYEQAKNTLNRHRQFYPGAGPEFFSDYWRVVNTYIKKQLPEDTNQLLTVRYEDICENPQEELRKICQFIEVEEANNELFKDIPIQKRTNEKFSNILGEIEQKACLEKADDVRKMFGYIEI